MTPSPGSDAPPGSDFDDLVERAFGALWALHPAGAVYLGKHEYDGLVPDWSDAQVGHRLDELRAVSEDLAVLAGLSWEQDIDRTTLLYRIHEEIFRWEELQEPLRNPMAWIYALDPDLYLKRSYATLDRRAAAAIRLLEHAAPFLTQARRRLEPVLATTICEWSIRAATGLADMIAVEVPEAFAALADAPDHAGMHSELEAAARRAATELRDFAAWLETDSLPRSGEVHAIGRDHLEELLRLSEIVEMSLEELLAIAEDDLERNLAAFVETAAGINEELDPREVYEQYVASRHAARGELVAATEAMLEEIRAFLVDEDIVTIPSEVRARVAATPSHLRWAFAMMDTPGPYETEATEAYYYVTPCEDSWTDEEAEAWLRTLNTFALEDISIHEAYPGHYVHFLHYQSAPTEVSKRLASYALSEGWAHYAEQMMWEEGFREGDPRFRLAQLSEALVRNCRFVCAIRIHAYGMTVDEATQFFVDNAFYEELAARKEAERGTFDPGYFSYTLGKLEILRVREQYREQQGSDYSLKAFHDRVLAWGAPPIGLLHELVVG
jgi:uncharacterized protein (DUF885 family)